MLIGTPCLLGRSQLNPPSLAFGLIPILSISKIPSKQSCPSPAHCMIVLLKPWGIANGPPVLESKPNFLPTLLHTELYLLITHANATSSNADSNVQEVQDRPDDVIPQETVTDAVQPPAIDVRPVYASSTQADKSRPIGFDLASGSGLDWSVVPRFDGEDLSELSRWVEEHKAVTELYSLLQEMLKNDTPQIEEELEKQLRKKVNASILALPDGGTSLLQNEVVLHVSPSGPEEDSDDTEGMILALTTDENMDTSLDPNYKKGSLHDFVESI